jgi:hypothetical protein
LEDFLLWQPIDKIHNRSQTPPSKLPERIAFPSLPAISIDGSTKDIRISIPTTARDRL